MAGECVFDWMSFSAGNFTIRATANVFGVGAVMNRRASGPRPRTDPTPNMVGWRESGNLFSVETFSILKFPPLASGSVRETDSFDPPMPDLASWQKYWGLENTGSRETKLQLRSRLSATLAQRRILTAEDFRLEDGVPAAVKSMSAGANVDLVGPGPACERWRKSAAYQQWLASVSAAVK
jgi:hypothetical protein